MGRQIQIYALKEDAHDIIRHLSTLFPDMVRYDYYKGYIGLYDDALNGQCFFLAHEIPYDTNKKTEPTESALELIYCGYSEPRKADSRFSWMHGRIYLCTWWDPSPEQIELYSCAAKYIKKNSWRFKYGPTIFYILPHAAELILHLQQNPQDECGPLPDILQNAELTPPKGRMKALSTSDGKTAEESIQKPD